MLGELEGDEGHVVADLEAGTGTVLRLRAGQVDAVVIVAQPTAKAIDVAARAARIAAHRELPAVVVANRVRGEEDVAAIRAAVGDLELVVVPDDPAVARADREGLAPVDVDARSPAVLALGALAERLAGGRDASRPPARINR